MERRNQFVTRKGAITATLFWTIGLAVGGLGVLFGREPESIGIWMLIWTLGVGSAVLSNYALWRARRHFKLD